MQVVCGPRASGLDLIQEPVQGPGLVGGQRVEHDRVHFAQNFFDPVVVDVVGATHQVPESLNRLHALKINRFC